MKNDDEKQIKNKINEEWIKIWVKGNMFGSLDCYYYYYFIYQKMIIKIEKWWWKKIKNEINNNELKFRLRTTCLEV